MIYLFNERDCSFQLFVKVNNERYQVPTWAALLFTVTATGVQQAWQAQDVALGAVIIEFTAGPHSHPQIHSVTTKTIVSYNYRMQPSHTKSSHTIIILTMISYHVFGMTYYLNSAPFLCLHRRHCQSQDIIFTCLLYPSPPGPSTQN